MWGPAHTKVRPDRFGRFDLYWLQTDRQTEMQSIFIDNYVVPWIKLNKTFLIQENFSKFIHH